MHKVKTKENGKHKKVGTVLKMWHSPDLFVLELLLSDKIRYLCKAAYLFNPRSPNFNTLVLAK